MWTKKIGSDSWVRWTCLDGDEKFICFRDEDGEDVLYGTDHIDAVEMFDPFYLDEAQVEKILGAMKRTRMRTLRMSPRRCPRALRRLRPSRSSC
jgi:hypothetical protein